MLVLTRRPQEALIIGHKHEIKLKVISIKGKQVCIGIQAPESIPIYREEVWLRLQKNQNNLMAEKIEGVNDER